MLKTSSKKMKVHDLSEYCVLCGKCSLTYTLKSLNHVNHRNIKIRQSYTISLVSSMGTRHYLVLLFNSLGRQWQFEIYLTKGYYCDLNRLPTCHLILLLLHIQYSPAFSDLLCVCERPVSASGF